MVTGSVDGEKNANSKSNNGECFKHKLTIEKASKKRTAYSVNIKDK